MSSTAARRQAPFGKGSEGNPRGGDRSPGDTPALVLVPHLRVRRLIVTGYSMEPTLHDGQAVYVNKLLMGGRIYTDFNFNSGELHRYITDEIT